LAVAETIDDGAIQLEGQDLVVIPLGHTDTDDTTCLYVPSIGLVVAGDAVYNDVHLYLAESSSASRRVWIEALDTIESLRPRAEVAGHKRPERDDDPRIIEETRQYIRDFDRIAETEETALELYERMLAARPPPELWRPVVVSTRSQRLTRTRNGGAKKTARNGSAEWHGDITSGSGTVTVGTGVFEGAYSYGSRFGEDEGTNPEQLIAAAQAAASRWPFRASSLPRGMRRSRWARTRASSCATSTVRNAGAPRAGYRGACAGRR
jgi:hypothetical protein